MSKNLIGIIKMTEKEITILFDKIAATEGNTVKIVIKDELVSVDKKTAFKLVSGLYFELKRDELNRLIKETGTKRKVLAEKIGIIPVRFSQIMSGSVNSSGDRMAIDLINEGIELLKI